MKLEEVVKMNVNTKLLDLAKDMTYYLSKTVNYTGKNLEIVRGTIFDELRVVEECDARNIKTDGIFHETRAGEMISIIKLL